MDRGLRSVKRAYLPPAALILVLVVARLWLAGAGTTPDGQPSFAELTSVDDLKMQFNAERQTVRAIALLSPSCPYCLKGATDTQRVLANHPRSEIKVFVVWQPILPTDWMRPNTAVLHRLDDVRVRQFWNADRAVGQVFRRSFERRESQPSCCYHGDVWWDMVAVFPRGAEWTETLPEPLLLEGTVGDAAPAFDALPSK
jgi:hypothetical protein